MKKINIKMLSIIGIILGICFLSQGVAAQTVSPQKDHVMALRQLQQSREALQSFNSDNKKLMTASMQETISGTVTDAQTGDPLPGVNILVVGTSTGAATDSKGHYSLQVESLQDTLRFSFIGYKTKKVPIDGRTVIDIQLKPTVVVSGNQLVVVGYGTKRKKDVTSSISSVKGSQINTAPVTNVSNTLGGRLSGVISRRSSGAPGSSAEIRIRGIGTIGNSNPLVVVDGVPMKNYNLLDPSEIASVTVLKDAAAVAPYGMAGANGVVLIKTKRGKQGKFSFNYDGYYGFQQPTRIPEYLGSYGYAKQENIANKNVGNAPPYSKQELQKFKNGSDPNHYPNTDWVHDVINFHSPIMHHLLSFSGGTKKIQVYSNLGYLYQQGVVKPIYYKKYNVGLNVDAEVTPSTTISLDLHPAITKSHHPGGRTGTGIFTDVTEIPPIFPLKFSNGKPGNKMLPSIYKSGYNKGKTNFFGGKLKIEQDVPSVPGLSFKGVYAYRKINNFGKIWDLPYYFYQLNAQGDFVKQHQGPPAPTLNESFKSDVRKTIQGYINYKHTFGNKHHIDLLGVVERRSGTVKGFNASRINYSVDLPELSLGSSDRQDFNNGGSSSHSAQIGFVYRADYAYKGRYLVGVSGRYDGHYYFAPGHRFAFFPAVSVGWRLSKEHFISDHLPWLDNLKIRGSYGESGNLAGGPFQYLRTFGLRNSYVFGGTSPHQTQGIYETIQPNPNITWEVAKKADIGLDADFWNGKLGLTIDFFKNKRSNMLLTPQTQVPAYYGIGLPQVNAGVMVNKGLDFSVKTNQHFTNGFQLNASFNFSYAKNKLIQTFETAATYNNPNRRRTGRPLNTKFGLKAIGLYQKSDFNANGKLKKGEPVPTYGPVQPGDIKYADLAGSPGPNGKPTEPDDKIDINDYTDIGKPNFPGIIFGLNYTLRWKGLSLYMLWQGAGDTNIYLMDELAFPFYNRAKIAKYQTDYWTPQNKDAKFPRLTPVPTTNNNQPSSWWIRNGTYLRLKTMQLSYSLSTSIINTLSLRSIKIYVSGQNMLTFSQFPYVDPELGNNRARYYFQQKEYIVGLKIGF